LFDCACEGLWLHGLLDDIGFGFVGPTILKCDDQSAIKLTKNLVFQDKSKRFEKDWHFAFYLFNKLNKDVDYILIIDQPMDLLMKVVGRTKFDTR
jgi:hypothetical protein